MNNRGADKEHVLSDDFIVAERDIIGFDRSNQRVLFLAADSDVEQVTSQLQHMKRYTLQLSNELQFMYLMIVFLNSYSIHLCKNG